MAESGENARVDLAARNLPDPLRCEDGTPVTSEREWTERRRPELLNLFREQVYGRTPVGRPPDLTFETVRETPGVMDGTATEKMVFVRYSGTVPGSGTGKISLTVFLPTHATPEAPVPALILICNRMRENIDPTRALKSPFWPAEEMVARGYAAIAFGVEDAAPDWDDGCRSGVFSLFGEGQQTGDGWATIAAWAWAASRALDYCEAEPLIDAKRVGVVGHSRGGKTALWAGAQDERFAFVVSNDSGCTGASPARGTAGETVEMINRVFPYWFCRSYRQWNHNEDAMPVDQHELIALIAPRPVYVASATDDKWADPKGEFLACVAAEPVYRLFGRDGVGPADYPAPESPRNEGFIGYHLRTGGHNLTKYDWERFMDFADRRARP